MDDKTAAVVRAAAYEQVRADLRGSQGRKTTKKVTCTPPNVKCGGRCIPPTWDCRLKGQGTNSELKSHSQDISAGIASTQRGAVDLYKGARQLNPARFERGRRSVIRGAVKIAPGDNLEQKKALKRKLEKHSNGIAAVVGIGLAVGGGYAVGRKVLPSNWRKAIEEPAKKAFNAVLDKAPYYGAQRARIRAGGGMAASTLGAAAARDARLGQVQNAAKYRTSTGMGPMAFRTRSMDKEGSGLDEALDAINKSAATRGYDSWRTEAGIALFEAKNARGHRVFSERAANEYLDARFGLELSRNGGTALARGTGGKSDTERFGTQAGRNATVTNALAAKLNVIGQDMNKDMKVRGIVDRDRYIRQVALPGVERKLGGLTGDAKKNALQSARKTIEAAMDGNGVARAKDLHRVAVEDYDKYFAGIGTELKRFGGRPMARESPVGDVDVALARFEIGRKTGTAIQPVSKSHNQLLLKHHYHTKVVGSKSDFLVTEKEARNVAKDITRATSLPSAERAYGILRANGFPNASSGKSTAPRTPAKPAKSGLKAQASLTEMARAIMAEKGNEGMSLASAYREANRRKKKRKDRMDDEHMSPTITKRNPPAPLVTNSVPTVVSAGQATEHLPSSDDEMVTPLIPISKMKESPSPKEAEQAAELPKRSGTVKIELKLEVPASAIKNDAMPPRVASYLQVRNDLRGKSSPRGANGKPCGESYIPKAHDCRIGKGTAKPDDKEIGSNRFVGMRNQINQSRMQPGNEIKKQKIAPKPKPLTPEEEKKAKQNEETKAAVEKQVDKDGSQARKYAVAALGAGAAVVAGAVAVDAMRYHRNNFIPDTGNYKKVLKAQLKADGLKVKDSAQAMSNYYDKVVKEQNWRMGETVYYKAPGDKMGHYGVYIGKRDGQHQFVGAGVLNNGPNNGKVSGQIGVTAYGKTTEGSKNNFDSKPVVWSKVPDKLQPPRETYSDTEIAKRAIRMAGKPYAFSLAQDNCEAWATMIVSGVPHSKQVERFTGITKTILRLSNRPYTAANGGGYSNLQQAMMLALEHNKYIKDEEEGLPDPKDILKPGMTEMEAMSAIKNYLMLLIEGISPPSNGSN